jgi:tetratricopeptide (TPR) repeat protein
MQFMSVADHCQYYAVTGVIALLVAAGTALARRFPERVRIGLGCAVVALAFVMTWARATAFRSEERIYRDAIAKNPKAFLAHLHLGNILHEQGHHQAALEHYKAAAEWGGHMAETHYNLGTLRLGRNVELEEAIEDFTEVLRSKPSRTEAYFKRGLAKLRLEDLVGALSDFNAVLFSQPAHANARYFRARLLTRLQDLEGAVRDYGHALEHAPPDWAPRAEAVRLLAATTLAMRKRAVAGTAADPAADPVAEQKKAVAGLLLLRGAEQFTKGEDLGRAIELFSAVLKLDPDSADARRLRGMTRLRTATDLAGAYEDLTVAIRDQPESADARFVRGRLKMAMRDVEGAVRDIEAGLEIAPADWPFREEARRALASARLAIAARDARRR